MGPEHQPAISTVCCCCRLVLGFFAFFFQFKTSILVWDLSFFITADLILSSDLQSSVLISLPQSVLQEKTVWFNISFY